MLILEKINPKKNIKEIQKIITNATFENNISYFLSWSWIENWLMCLPETIPIIFFVLRDQGEPICAFFISNVRRRLKILAKVKTFNFNCTGINEYDLPLWIEYNSFWYSNRFNMKINDLIRMLPDEWDEMELPALSPDSYPGCEFNNLNGKTAIGGCGNFNIVVEKILPSYFVDLNSVRDNSMNYVGLLTANSRSQIKKNYRLFNDNYGTISIDEASTANIALDYFDKLFQLHKNSWQAREMKSNFIASFSYLFHRRLISNNFSNGEIQLLRIRAGEHELGYLYNFLYKNKAYFYQCAFNSFENKKLSPGIISHVEAIKYNANKMLNTYDFLAGHERYKSSLSTNNVNMKWIKIQKNSIKFRLENKIKSLYNRYKKNDYK